MDIDQQHQAAVRIQAIQRGRKSRRDACRERPAVPRRPVEDGGGAEASDSERQESCVSSALAESLLGQLLGAAAEASDSEREEECVSSGLAESLLGQLLGAAAEGCRASVETVQAPTSCCDSVETVQGVSSLSDDSCVSECVAEVLHDQLLAAAGKIDCSAHSPLSSSEKEYETSSLVIFCQGASSVCDDARVSDYVAEVLQDQVLAAASKIDCSGDALAP